MTVIQQKRTLGAVATAAAILTMATTGLGARQACAQQPRPGQRTTAQVEKEIGVTAAQHAKIDNVKKKYDPKLKALQPRMVAAQKQMQQVQKDYITIAQAADKEMQAILTPTQRAKLKAMQEADAKKYQQMMQQGGGGRPGGGQ